MIRIKDIPLPLQHSVAQLSFEAAQLLRVSNSTIRSVKIVRRSIDARKKPDVKYTYTIDVQVSGNEEKILVAVVFYGMTVAGEGQHAVAGGNRLFGLIVFHNAAAFSEIEHFRFMLMNMIADGCAGNQADGRKQAHVFGKLF